VIGASIAAIVALYFLIGWLFARHVQRIWDAEKTERETQIVLTLVMLIWPLVIAASLGIVFVAVIGALLFPFPEDK
jgi:NhaP-type Na+/H+ or K+/H+ antiporter